MKAGEGIEERIGNRIFVKSITLLIAADLGTTRGLHFIVYQNKNGTATANAAPLNTDELINYNKNWSGFTILHEKFVSVEAQ